MKMKKCAKCGKYTLKKEHCSLRTKDAGYKFVKVKPKKDISQNNK
jgi:rRNA maturation protein Nop10